MPSATRQLALRRSALTIIGAFNDAVGALRSIKTWTVSATTLLATPRFCSMVLPPKTLPLVMSRSTLMTHEGGLANNNTAVGAATLLNNVDGSENTIVGASSGQEILTGFNNTYLGNFVGTGAGDESSTIRINDVSGGNAQECFIGGIFNNFQPVNGTTIVQVTLDLTNDHLGWDMGPNQARPSVPSRGAPAKRGVPQPAGRAQAPAMPQRPSSPQRQAMLNDKVEKLQAMVAQQQARDAQQQKQIETLTAQLKEQATQIQKVSAEVEMVRSTPQVVANKP